MKIKCENVKVFRKINSKTWLFLFFFEIIK